MGSQPPPVTPAQPGTGVAPSELGEFLRSRRARLRPEQVRLPMGSASRRVPGLRREELALLAGVSVDYYSRLEQGRAKNVSPEVLDAIAAALMLDPYERQHLQDLAHTSRKVARTDPGPPAQARPALRMMLDALDPVPVLIHNTRLDVVAINRMGKVLLDDFDAMPWRDRNLARWMFLNPRARVVYPHWPQLAAKMVAILRTASGRGRPAVGLAELVDELAGRSEEFKQYWNDYEVYRPTNGTKLFFHEAVGVMTVNHESLTPTADQDLSLLIYTAATASPSEAKLKALSDWSEARLAPTSTGAG